MMTNFGGLSESMHRDKDWRGCRHVPPYEESRQFGGDWLTWLG